MPEQLYSTFKQKNYFFYLIERLGTKPFLCVICENGYVCIESKHLFFIPFISVYSCNSLLQYLDLVYTVE